MRRLSLGEAAKLKGVSISTLRRWEAEGKLVPERTASGHRRYEMSHRRDFTEAVVIRIKK